MGSEYTMEQVRRMTQEEQNSKLKSAYSRQTTWREQARQALSTRQKSATGGSRFDMFLRNYNAKYIRTGSAMPIAHIMAIVVTCGVTVEYLAHHRHAKSTESDH